MRPVAWLLVGIGWIAGCAPEQTSEDSTSAALDLKRLVVASPWVRPGFEGGMSALYVRIENGASTDDTLLAVRTDVADTAEIHESYENDDGTRGMRPVGSLRIPAGERVALAPGGLHVMLIQLDRPLQAGDSVAIELQFAQAGTRSVNGPVRLRPPPKQGKNEGEEVRGRRENGR